jgi:hypothetical protein
MDGHARQGLNYALNRFSDGGGGPPPVCDGGNESDGSRCEDAVKDK